MQSLWNLNKPMGYGKRGSSNSIGGVGYAHQQFNPYAALMAQRNAALQQQRGFADSIIANIRQAQEQARAANEARYNEARGIARQATEQSLGDIGRGADIQRRDAENQFGDLAARTRQETIDNGLLNSTVNNYLQKGVTRSMNRAFQDIESRRRAEIARARGELADREIGVIQSRTDAYPSPGAYMGALQGLGSVPTVAGWGAAADTPVAQSFAAPAVPTRTNNLLNLNDIPMRQAF